jgi:hypothetical protein
MKTCVRLWGVLLLILVFATGLTSPSSECELRKSKDGIQVFACDTPDSKLKSISATFQLDASISTLASHVMDIAAYPHWQYKVSETELIERVNEHELVYRGEVKAPWPVSNRDLVVRLRISQDPKTKVTKILAISEPDRFPQKQGVVRVPKSETRWVITPISNTRLQVEYYFSVDPGGSIPGWLLNLTIAEGPYQTFKSLIARINTDVPVKPVSFKGE